VNERIAQLRRSLDEPLLVTAAVNVRYLVDFQSSNVALLVDEDRVVLFTDFRYAEAARAVEGAEFVQTERSVYATLAEQLEGRIAFEATALTYANWQTLRNAGIELIPRTGAVERLRAVKDEAEVATIREAARITDDVYAAFAEEAFVCHTEHELAWRMEQLFHELGAHSLSFELIVASGRTGATPHGRPTDRVIEPNTTVVVDAGCVVDGYHSDCTRTFATGELPDELANAYQVCLRAQLAGLELLHPGVSGADADAAARKVIDDVGLGEKFGHGLGHGVGLELHEAPVARPESTDLLQVRNVITCEPGIYLEGRGGVRIEDLVVVTEGEPEILSRYTKELVTVR